jgi:hypothetical protein
LRCELTIRRVFPHECGHLQKCAGLLARESSVKTRARHQEEASGGEGCMGALRFSISGL